MCGVSKTFDRFANDNRKVDGKQARCRDCCNLVAFNRRKNFFFEEFHKAKGRTARASGIEFTITVQDIKDIWTGICPVLQIPIEYNLGLNEPNQAHLDRINPNKGYVAGNICWISSRINLLKRNATLDELQKILKYMESRLNNV